MGKRNESGKKNSVKEGLNDGLTISFSYPGDLIYIVEC
jgi:hypothetical protein